MFSTAVYLLEGFLMKQDAIAVLVEYLFEYFHGDEVMKDRFASLLIITAELELIARHLVMLSLKRNSNLKKFKFHFLQDLFHTMRQFTIIVVAKFLITLSHIPNQCSPCILQILSLQEILLFYHKELLL